MLSRADYVPPYEFFAQVLSAGGFPVRLRLSGHALARGTLVRILVTAVDPWGRKGAFTVSFRAP